MKKFDIGILTRKDARMYVSDITVYAYHQILLLSRAYDINVGIFSIPDFYEKDGRGYSKVTYWNGREFVTEEAELPYLLDTTFPLIRNSFDNDTSVFLKHLHQRRLLRGNTVTKRRLMPVLLAAGLAEYAIPTQSVKSYEEAYRAASIWNKAMAKPAFDSMGRGIFALHKDGEKLIYETTEESGELTDAAWSRLTKKDGENREYLIQPRMNFSAKDGYALDFRLLVNKGRTGEWELVEIEARIGGSSLVSNVAAGGTIFEKHCTLNAQYGDQAGIIEERLEHLARVIPCAIERFAARPPICLGIDVGIDRDTLLPYVLEVNGDPGTHQMWLLAKKRIEYYLYVLEEKKADEEKE